MRYFIQKRNTKNPPFWRIQLRSYGNDKKPTKNIPQKDYEGLGFSLLWDITKAKARAAQLNTLKDIEKETRSKHNSLEKRKLEDRAIRAYLPPALVESFEDKMKKSFFGTEGDFYKCKKNSVWRRAKQLIIDLKLGSVSEWGSNSNIIHKYLAQNTISVSYSKKIIGLLNAYGEHQSPISKIYFERVQLPKGKSMDMISTEASKNKSKESIPLTEDHLRVIKENMKESNYNWLYISKFLGLRPVEVDSLAIKDPDKWKIQEDAKGRTFYSIYQTKLISLSPDKRWKHIPVILPQQKILREMIESGNIKRPILKTLRKVTSEERLGLYGGRKAFESMFLDMGEKGLKITYAQISSWLGHSSVDQTWKNYKNRKRVSFPDLD